MKKIIKILKLKKSVYWQNLNIKIEECRYASNLKGFSGETDILGFFSPRWHDKYNVHNGNLINKFKK